MVAYEGPERREQGNNYPINSEEFLNDLAERAAERAFEKMYAKVGKGVLNRLAWLVGAAAVALIWWLGSKGVKIE